MNDLSERFRTNSYTGSLGPRKMVMGVVRDRSEYETALEKFELAKIGRYTIPSPNNAPNTINIELDPKSDEGKILTEEAKLILDYTKAKLVLEYVANGQIFDTDTMKVAKTLNIGSDECKAAIQNANEAYFAALDASFEFLQNDTVRSTFAKLDVDQDDKPSPIV